MGKIRCNYNISKNEPTFLPIIECGRKAKYTTSIHGFDESYDLYLCNKHKKEIEECSNIEEIDEL